jgi:hypothetical protein
VPREQALVLRDQGDAAPSESPEPVDQIGLFTGTEGPEVDRPDGGEIAAVFFSEKDHAGSQNGRI